MLFLILFSLILIVFFFFRHPKNIYAIIYSVEMLSICLIILANIIYSLRFCQYSYIYHWEYQIYRSLSRIPVSFFDIRILINISLLFFLLTSTFLILFNRKSRKLIFLCLPAVCLLTAAFALLYLNSPHMVEKLYLLNHTKDSLFLHIATFAIRCFNMAVLLYIFAPCCIFLWDIYHSKIIFKKNHLCLLLILHVVLYMTYLSFLLLLPAKTMFNNFNLYNISAKKIDEKMLLSIGIIFFIFVLLMVFFNYETLDEKIFHADIKPPKYAQFFSNDIRHLLHNYKNTILSIKLLTEQAINNYGSEDSLKALENINQNAETFLKKAHRFLDIYNNVPMEFEQINISKCIEAACSAVTIPENVQIEKSYSDDSLFFYGDDDLITEVITNLVANAIDSIQKSGKSEKKILIHAWSEAPWLCVDVTDNGVGIPRKHQKEIFKPLFSTKKSMNNWGIGLSFVKNVLDAHSGYIHLRSRKNCYAKFQITLPLEA